MSKFKVGDIVGWNGGYYNKYFAVFKITKILKPTKTHPDGRYKAIMIASSEHYKDKIGEVLYEEINFGDQTWNFRPAYKLREEFRKE